jgi:tartrate dehydratase beta subunit/fumarate hydratase class I family protein
VCLLWDWREAISLSSCAPTSSSRMDSFVESMVMNEM